MRRTAASTSAFETVCAMTLPALACAQMFEVHPEAHWLLDDTGALLHANRAALRMMGNLAVLPTGANVADFIAGGAAQGSLLVRQGMRSNMPTPARVRLLTGNGAEVACRCEIALLNPATEEAHVTYVPSQMDLQAVRAAASISASVAGWPKAMLLRIVVVFSACSCVPAASGAPLMPGIPMDEVAGETTWATMRGASARACVPDTKVAPAPPRMPAAVNARTRRVEVMERVVM